LRRTEEDGGSSEEPLFRSTFARPSASWGSTATPTTNLPWGSRGRPPRRNIQTNDWGVEGASPSWGSGGKAPGSREWRSARFLRGFPLSVSLRTARAAASDASGPQPQESLLHAVPTSNRLLLLN